MEARNHSQQWSLPPGLSHRIPKIIHYVWLTKPDNPKPIPTKFLDHTLGYNMDIMSDFQHVIWTNVPEEVASSIRKSYRWTPFEDGLAYKSSHLQVRSIDDESASLRLYPQIEECFTPRSLVKHSENRCFQNDECRPASEAGPHTREEHARREVKHFKECLGYAIDVLKYSVLELHGGIVVDLNFWFHRIPSDSELARDFFVISWENSFIASAPRSQEITYIVALCEKASKQDVFTMYGDLSWYLFQQYPPYKEEPRLGRDESERSWKGDAALAQESPDLVQCVYGALLNLDSYKMLACIGLAADW